MLTLIQAIMAMIVDGYTEAEIRENLKGTKYLDLSITLAKVKLAQAAQP